MIYLLHIDTSVDTGIVAVGGDGVLLASRSNTESRNHAATINNMIADVLADAAISLHQLSGIVVCAGPGSYTGLRIGMATAKGLCYALDKPLILDNRLDLLAYHARKKNVGTFTRYVSLLVARDKEYFISIYNNQLSCILAPQHIMEAQLDTLIDKKEKTCVITNAPADVITNLGINDFITDNDINMHLLSWIVYAFDEYNCNKIVNLANAEPFYLKQVYTHK
jgi:tRNA threonylcarbamoyladenosine biosynthesis protein TsaB